MPAVSVLPLRETAVVSDHQVSEARLLEAMASGEGMPEVEPVSHESDNGQEAMVERSQPDHEPTKTQSRDKDDITKSSDLGKKDNVSAGGIESPSQSIPNYPQTLPPHLTPQQPGYYVAYQSQVTPEPPSPAGQGATAVYDMGSFLQHPTGFSPFNGQHYAGAPVPNQRQPGQAPPSPSQNSIPPASPLFPRVTGQAALLDPHRMLDGSVPQQRGAPLSPAPAYLSPAVGHAAVMYSGMNAYMAQQGISMNGANSTASSEEMAGWADNR